MIRILAILVNNEAMEAKASVDVGVAGSITMIVLTLAVTLLLVSFYRRYKRMQDRKDQNN